MPTEQILLPRHSRAVPTHTRLVTRRVPIALYVTVLLLLPALVVTGAVTAGWWSTAGHAGVSLTGGGPGTGTGSGEAAAPAAPLRTSDVRGSMTVRQVVDAFPGLRTGEILAAFGVPADTPDSTALKTLVQDGNGLEIPAFRTWLEQRLSQ